MMMSKILTFGVYDYFHLGHLRLFKQCKNYGDYLIVAVQDGDYIKKYNRMLRSYIRPQNGWKCLNHCGSLTKWWCMNLLILNF